MNLKVLSLTALLLCTVKTDHQIITKQANLGDQLFEQAVEHIKQHEGWHTDPNHVGYGHKIKKGESFKRPITKEQGDSILRADLRDCISHFKHLGGDSLLMGVLAYNVGVYRLKGTGKLPKSTILKKLESSNRDIQKDYLSYRKWNGKIIKSIERRRAKEFDLFYIESHQPGNSERDSQT